MTNKLPQGWVECELKNVFDTSSGGTPKRGNPAYYGGNIPWLKSGELNNGIVTEAEEYITEEGLKNSSAKLFPRGSLLIALYGATVGKLGILDFDSTTNQAICCIYQNSNYNRDFLFYYLLFKKEYLVNQGKGGAQPNISQEIIKALKIPVPPLNEQKRIVEKIEEEFGKIDEGVEKLKLAQEQIKQYRQSVLKSAFDGKLYKTTEWEEKRLKQVCDVRDGTHDSPKYIDKGYPLITSKNLKNNKITYDNIKYVSENDYNKINERSKVNIGDVLFAMIGTIGNPVVVTEEPQYAIKNVALFKPTQAIDSHFLKHYLETTKVITKMGIDAKGSTQKFVPLGYLRDFVINLPTIDEQKQIVKEIEKHFKVADEAERVITENLEKAEQIKQSILKKAFEGRLVPQDPTDQPASELLAKIQAERNK